MPLSNGAIRAALPALFNEVNDLTDEDSPLTRAICAEYTDTLTGCTDRRDARGIIDETTEALIADIQRFADRLRGNDILISVLEIYADTDDPEGERPYAHLAADKQEQSTR